MDLLSRPAHNSDIPRLVSLYRDMEAEQTERKPIWALTDGLDERFDVSLLHAIQETDSFLVVGVIDDVAVGFLWATIEPMLDRAGGATIGRIRLIYTEPEARGVGVGDLMLSETLTLLRARGMRHFDAPVGPGHRHAKNFFESHGFAARSIIMHTADPAPQADE